MICKLPSHRRAAITLLEAMAALIIVATLAAVSLQYLRPANETGKQRACDLTRQLLQNDADRYLDQTGNLVSKDLRELRSDEYSGVVLPACPVTGESYRRNGLGQVQCPTHEKTRSK